MIFIYIMKNKYFLNRWSFFIVECYSIVWLLEFEMEKFKLSIIGRRINSWLKSYKMLSKYVGGILERIEHSKAGVIYSLFKELMFHTKQRFFVFLFLFNDSYKYLSTNPLIRHLLAFFELTIDYSRDTLTWTINTLERVISHEFIGPSAREKLKILGFNTSWVHRDDYYRTPDIFYSIRLLDAQKTWNNLVFFVFKAWASRIIQYKHIRLSLCYFFFILIVFFTTLLLFNWFYFSSLKSIWLNTILVIFLYIFISSYFHFSKIYVTSKYTSQNQRFWKRTFGIFWALEFTLFFIYMFLTLISPAELPMYAINYKEIITGMNISRNSNYHLLYIYVLCFMCFLYTVLIFLKKKNNFHFFKPVLLILNLLFCFVIYYEFLKFYYSSGWGTHTVHNCVKSFTQGFEYNSISTGYSDNTAYNSLYFKVPNTLNNTWNDVFVEKQWVRTFRHFIYVLTILKFWHVFFIYFYFTLSLVKFTETNYISFDVISSNYQNSLYIVWFYLFSYLLILKKKLYFLITFIYYWSSVQVNFVNVLYSFLSEVNIVFLV